MFFQFTCWISKEIGNSLLPRTQPLTTRRHNYYNIFGAHDSWENVSRNGTCNSVDLQIIKDIPCIASLSHKLFAHAKNIIDSDSRVFLSTNGLPYASKSDEVTQIVSFVIQLERKNYYLLWEFLILTIDASPMTLP